MGKVDYSNLICIDNNLAQIATAEEIKQLRKMKSKSYTPFPQKNVSKYIYEFRGMYPGCYGMGKHR